jgi:hypothetical protein
MKGRKEGRKEGRKKERKKERKERKEGKKDGRKVGFYFFSEAPEPLQLYYYCIILQHVNLTYGKMLSCMAVNG